MKTRTIDRRVALKSAAALASLASLDLRAGSATHRARLVLHPESTLNSLPDSYNGFSIETATLENPDVYHPGNRSLVSLFRELTPRGVLRLGGNSSEFCWWKADEQSQRPEIHVEGHGRTDNWMPQKFHAITPRAVDNLRGFLDACGWTCVYGLNFGTGSTTRRSRCA